MSGFRFLHLMIRLGILTVLILSTACVPKQTPPLNLTPTGAPAENNNSVPTPTKTVPPTSTQAPTKTAKPTPTPEPAPPGTSRSNPFFTSDFIPMGNWDIRVSQYLRGEEAWKILEPIMVNFPAGDGREYVAVYIQAINRHADGQPHEAYGCMLVQLTGEKNQLYSCAIGINPPIEAYKTLSAGEMAEGWVVFNIEENEGNLIVVKDLTDHNGGDPDYRYIALEENSSVNIPPDVMDLQPNDVGLDQDHPASISDTIIMKNWKFTISDIKRGEDAWQLIQPASEFNPPAADGFEYVLLKIEIERIGSTENALYLGFGLSFDGLDSSGQPIDTSGIDGPHPDLGETLYPGGKDDGWVVVTVEKDNPNALISVWDFADFSPEDSGIRYFTIDQ